MRAAGDLKKAFGRLGKSLRSADCELPAFQRVSLASSISPICILLNVSI
jgi:hypothetical protein